MPFRKIIFWLHLATGLVAGSVIAVMCLTGATLAFEKEIVAWSERDARLVAVPPAGTPRLSLEELQRRVRTAQPEARPTGVILQHDPAAAVAFSTGRTGAFYANPYTGEVRQPKSTAVQDFMQSVEDWHHTLALSGDRRAVGKFINDACNLAFFLLAVTGLCLWWPRSWSSVRAVALFKGRLSGRARDFNRHNVTGVWCAPVLIVLTVTAIPLSYRWASNLIYTATGTEAPAAGGAGSPVDPAPEIPAPSAEAKPLAQDALFALVQQQVPDWQTITLRTGAAGGRGGPRNNDSAPRENRGRTPQPVVFTIRTGTGWPRTATTTLTLNPYTGEILRRENFGDQNLGRQVRTWTRFLHTGEALGWGGQLAAGLACLGGSVLVYTGFALAWRRFFGKTIPPATGASVPSDG